MEVLTQVTWRQGRIVFELSSPDEAILQRAAEVLGYWNIPADQELARLQMSASINPDGFQFSASTGESGSYRDLATLIRVAETQAALYLVDRAETALTVHGALLERNGRSIIIVGPSGAGKSTTSCALWAAGWRLLADDVTLIDPPTGQAQPVLRRVSLRHPSRALLGENFWQHMLAAKTCDETPEGFIFHPDELEGVSRARTVPLSAIIFLGRQVAAVSEPATLQPVSSAKGLLSLCPYTNVIRKYDMGVAMDRVGSILHRTSFYDMSRGPLPEMVAALNQLVEEKA